MRTERFAALPEVLIEHALVLRHTAAASCCTCGCLFMCQRIQEHCILTATCFNL